MRQVWTLEPFFSDGSSSSDLVAFINRIENRLAQVAWLSLPEAVLLSQEVKRDLTEAKAFVNCLIAQDVGDLKAKELQAKINGLNAEIKKIKVLLDERLAALSDREFEQLFGESEIHFHLLERRELAKKRLSAEKEAIIEDLAVDGYHGWSNYHNTLVDSMSFPFQGEKLSQGQIDNQFSKGDRSVRKLAFESFLSTFKEKENHFGAILNHIGGFRLKMYKARGWSQVTEEPCDYNRISDKTLEAMWGAVAKNRERFTPFLKEKAKILGLEKLSWYDLEAPIGEERRDIPFDEGAAFIVNHFHAVSPKMAQFAKGALEKGWVEAEDRKNKQPGGFCTSFPKSRQTRIFMTYGGTISNIETLAHELGHAFHADCCFSLPYFNQNYAMNVAETASTMAEMIVADAAYKAAGSVDEKLSLLNNKLMRSVAYLMNIHGRFLFETKFYEERAKGFILPARLSEMMTEALKEAYADSLEEVNPLFWASKLHFYLTEVPFYNFPYTFGYLFSLGIYNELMKDPASFEEKYMALLQDTGRMKTEDLARKHLGVDLTKSDFWQGAIDKAAEDVLQFVALNNHKH